MRRVAGGAGAKETHCVEGRKSAYGAEERIKDRIDIVEARSEYCTMKRRKRRKRRKKQEKCGWRWRR